MADIIFKEDLFTKEEVMEIKKLASEFRSNIERLHGVSYKRSDAEELLEKYGKYPGVFAAEIRGIRWEMELMEKGCVKWRGSSQEAAQTPYQ